jgi:hypothetical protein
MRDPVEIARLFLFVREAGQNRGLRVEAIQHWSQGQFGDSWCAEFATMVLDLAFQGNAPIPRQGGAQDIRDLATKAGWITDTPSVGDLFLYVDANDHAHHVGIVSSVDPLLGIAGNTDANGTSSNGDRVAEHAITAHVFVAYPR